uniref:Uncharacterized protein n=1 Tax=Opuntia streptacantha TaxID=393608 RepID=A0A7C9E767_OPUST
MAPIPCSLTPNLKFLSSGVSFWKFPNIFSNVMFEEARSALPPRKAGRTLASAFRHCCDRFLVASAGLSVVYVGSAFSQPAGNSTLIIDFNSAASSLYFFSYSANLAFHSASRAPP